MMFLLAAYANAGPLTLNAYDLAQHDAVGLAARSCARRSAIADVDGLAEQLGVLPPRPHLTLYQFEADARERARRYRDAV